MSFRTRLTAFFLLIVIVPMLSVAVVVFYLIAGSETGKADARLAEGQAAAIGVYGEASEEAAAPARRVGADPLLTQALTGGDRAGATARARALLRERRLERIVISDGRRTLVSVGSRSAIAPANRDLVAAGGRRVARLQVSTTGADEYAERVERLTTLDVIVRRGGRELAATGPSLSEHELPDVGDIEEDGDDYRVASFSARAMGGGRLRIAVVEDAGDVTDAVSQTRLLAAGVLIGFLVLAFAFALAVSRSLQAQIGRFLDAARRLGAGDFATRVPTEGRDEFAELGEEFNKMSRELESKIADLDNERQRLETSIRRIGDTFASNLDREALLEIAVRTAIDGVGGAVGRGTVRAGDHGRFEERARSGHAAADAEDALRAAEAEALDRHAPAAVSRDGHHALAFPLRPAEDSERVLGIVSVARGDPAFTERERELFNYLAGQAAVSIENVDLHELVQRQAVTDELTGLFNHRRFQEVVDAEVERARRFDQDVGLLMLDIDDFKKINDTYGHQQGDIVLREVARVLKESSREVDEPARYGGEEMAVALPQTDLEGAYNLAERVRTSIAALRVRRLDGEGALEVTASFGVAALPECAGDKESLIAAADAALYEAKRAGKNRTVRATPTSPGAVAG